MVFPFFAGLYLGIVTVLAAFGILISIMILVLFNHDGEPESSCILAITRFAAKVTCSTGSLKITPVTKVAPVQENGHTSRMSNEEQDIMYKASWSDVAKVLDRFCFIMFGSVTVLINVSFVIAISIGEDARN